MIPNCYKNEESQLDVPSTPQRVTKIILNGVRRGSQFQKSLGREQQVEAKSLTMFQKSSGLESTP